jgi:hypothetical protein
MIRMDETTDGGWAGRRRAPGPIGLLARSVWLACLIFALLVAAVPARSDTAIGDKSPVATAFSKDSLAILRQVSSTRHYLDGRSRPLWSRGTDSGSASKASAGGSVVIGAVAALVLARAPHGLVPHFPTACGPCPFRHFDAQGPPAHG